MPILGNPLGLLALLGIPAVLAIHFLQRKAKELPVSTLFLLERTRREAAGGRRFERIVPSVPLWMQLLAVLLLAWFLADPRYPRESSVQRVAVVVDSSASMSVFKEQALAAISENLPAMRGGAGALRMTVLESAPGRPPLFAGESTEGLAGAWQAWQPRDGRIDPAAALRVARSLVAAEGRVVYLTDTPADGPLPFGALPLAVGEAFDNVGFTGVSFDTVEGATVWRALVRNHGAAPAERTWSLQTATGSTEARPLRIEPGALVSLQAAFPADAENVRVVLSPDRFPLDDVLPLVAPRPKPLVLFDAVPAALEPLAGRLVKALEGAERGRDAASADLMITAYNPLDPVLPERAAILFVEDETRAGEWLRGGIVAEGHPLMAGLYWQALLVRESLGLERRPTDRVLLWQDTRPLIMLRENPGAPQLLFNFDPTLSNVETQASFIVLLHRFAETIREAKVAAVAANLETGQPIRLTSRPGAPLAVRATDTEGSPLPAAQATRAITTPGFMRVSQDGEVLLDAAVHFGDPREADFKSCGSAPFATGDGRAEIERHTKPDPLWRVWLVVLLAALLVSWKFTAPTAAQPA